MLHSLTVCICFELMNPVVLRFLLATSSNKRKVNGFWREIDVLKLCLCCCGFGIEHCENTKSSIKLLFILSQAGQLRKHRINSVVLGTWDWVWL